MKNIIVGTAGHVDHGKTCLIKALTGIDCDRLKEEKKRGITIENGFADMVVGDYNVSIIDVPGHEKFIKNMLMGIGGIDMVLLVIGLDEGVMPQTVEHFRILEMLDIRRGIIVYTKRDLVTDEEWIEMVKEDAHELVKGTFLEGAPEIEVSSYDGYNIEELRKLILETIDDSVLKNDSSSMFRLPVDRVFTIDGFGTVITGTLMEGSIRQGDDVMVYPGGKVCKVRNVQVHNENVTEALAGQRTALNLQGLKKDDLERGRVLAKPDSLEPSKFLDVRLELFRDSDRPVLNGSRVHFHSGSSEAVAKVILLDRDSLERGDSCYCQLKLEEEVAVRRNDRFIIRFFSPLITLGGGRILETSAVKHKRFDEKTLEALSIKDQGTIKEVLEITVKEQSRNFPDNLSLALKINHSPEGVKALLEELLKESRIFRVKKDGFIHLAYLERAEELACGILTEYHKANSMSGGLPKAEFLSRLLKELRTEDRKAGESILDLMKERKVLKENSGLISLYDFKIKESPEMVKLRERILKKYREAGFEMPTLDMILSSEKDKKNAGHIVESLAEEGDLVRLDFQYYMARDDYDKAMKALMDHIGNNGRITLAEFRDILGTSRKYAMAFLDHTDRSKITEKKDDYRVLLKR
ncbi:MAG: selenocysteine-specific translation elongation factor [Firmicutes bacterium]|nr:selenocysteine-specific translation elongation factor [Bacillota bacterium]